MVVDSLPAEEKKRRSMCQHELWHRACSGHLVRWVYSESTSRHRDGRSRVHPRHSDGLSLAYIDDHPDLAVFDFRTGSASKSTYLGFQHNGSTYPDHRTAAQCYDYSSGSILACYQRGFQLFNWLGHITNSMLKREQHIGSFCGCIARRDRSGLYRTCMTLRV